YRSTDTSMADFVAAKGDVSLLLGLYTQGESAILQEAQTLKGVAIQQTPLLSLSFLNLYWLDEPFDDLRVRKAFALAIDRQTVAHDVYADTVQPSTHLIPEGMPGYNPNLVDAGGRTAANAFTADLDTARKLASAYAAEKCRGSYALCPAIDWGV